MHISTSNVTVIIPAAGVGQRFGSVLPKQYTNVCGIPIIIRTLSTIVSLPFVRSVVIAKSATDVIISELITTHLPQHAEIHLVTGGEQRVDSVLAALQHESVSDSDVVLIHDAVRPLASPSLFMRVLDATITTGAAIPGIPVTDTIKELDVKGAVARTVPRENLRAIQTPQGFRSDVVKQLLQSESNGATDEAMLAERCGIRVTVVDGEPWNIKITTPTDINLVEALLPYNPSLS